MSNRPTVRDFMSTEITSIGPDTSVRIAVDLMQDRAIRHLPVVEDGCPVGVITWSDINVLESVLQVDTERLLVGEVMTKHLATVHPDTPLSEAAERMAEGGIGSLVVCEGKQLVGMFTSTDAVRALAKLELHFRP